MPETREPVHTRPMKFTRYCLAQYISKLPGSFKIHRVVIGTIVEYLVNVVLFGIKGLETSEMTVKLKSNLYVGRVNIGPNFWHCISVSVMLT